MAGGIRRRAYRSAPSGPPSPTTTTKRGDTGTHGHLGLSGLRDAGPPEQTMRNCGDFADGAAAAGARRRFAVRHGAAPAAPLRRGTHRSPRRNPAGTTAARSARAPTPYTYIQARYSRDWRESLGARRNGGGPTPAAIGPAAHVTRPCSRRAAPRATSDDHNLTHNLHAPVRGAIGKLNDSWGVYEKSPMLRAGGLGIRLASTSAATRASGKILDSIIRVDHAGELGADRIYAGQMAVLGRTAVGPTIRHMWEQEKRHRAKFEELIRKHRVRPTVLSPLWNVAGFVLGAGTALMGEKAAMACTVAVETVIVEHYNEQLRVLMENGEKVDEEILETIRKFRDEEQEHHDTGIGHGAEQAPFYQALTNAIKFGCKTAICISKVI